MEIRAGVLLVASPVLRDPNFDRTVVALLAHDATEGCLGVVLNRPGKMPVVSALPSWADRAAAPGVVFSGGPVSPGAIVCVGRADGQTSDVLFDGVVSVDVSRDPDAIERPPSIVRVFSGYAGWDAGQLETEIRAGAWFVVGADPADLWADEPERLWRSVLRRQRGLPALVSTYPDDPTSN